MAQRVRGSVLVAPSRLGLFVDPYAGAAANEDAFSGGEGGEWVWYPLAGCTSLGKYVAQQWPGEGLQALVPGRAGHQAALARK